MELPNNKTTDSNEGETIQAAKINAEAAIRSAKIRLIGGIMAALIAAIVYLYIDHEKNTTSESGTETNEIENPEVNGDSDSEVAVEEKDTPKSTRASINRKYVTTDRRNGRGEDAAIMIIGTTKRESLIASVVASRLRTNDYSVTTNLFNDKFRKEAFSTIYEGAGESIRGSEFERYVDQIILGELRFSDYVNDRNMHDVRFDLDIHFYDAASLNLLDSKKLHGTALEWRLDKSKEQAIQKLIAKIDLMSL